MPSSAFSVLKPPVLKRLEKEGFLEASPIQELSIPAILKGENVLLIAPTGTGKTLAAILPVLDKFLEARSSEKTHGISILYVTPLRALNRDLLRRLEEIGRDLDVKIQVRHGDTPTSARSQQAKSPPDMLITTPETLQSILVGKRMKEHLRSVRWVVVDEVHELATDERGVQLSIALERLIELTGQEFQRIGLSATIGEPERIGQFLVGTGRQVNILRSDEERGLQISIGSVPPTGKDQEEALRLGLPISTVARARKILGLIEAHKSTLVFTNTREHAEALASQLLALGAVGVKVHHGSLSRELREEAEKEFQAGSLRALICTSSLELGIDIGSVDFIIQYTSPRETTRLVQRIGRSGHTLGGTSRGIILTITPDDILESAVLIQRAKEGRLERPIIHEKALDVLAHQIIGMLMQQRRMTVEQILHGQTWRVISVDEEKFHVEVEAAPPSLKAIPGWEGDMIPVQMDVASEVGKMRRTLALSGQSESGLEEAERERVASTLSLQGKQAKIPSDKLVLIEGFENSVIVHTCAGNLVNEALANAMAALFGSRLGSNIATQVDQYRFGLIFPRPVSAHMVAEEFRKLTPNDLESMIHETVEASDLFAWKHWHVLRRIGAVSRQAEYKARQARLLVDIFKNSIANKETRRELFAEKLDVEGAKKILSMISAGEISIDVIQDAGQCTPLALPLLDRIVPHGLLRPAIEETSIIDVVKSRLLSTKLRLLCMNCGEWDGIRTVDNLQDKVRCPKCRSTLIAATYLSDDALPKIILKKMRSAKLSGEEEKEWMTAWRSAGLLQTYGKKAGLVLAARGVGPTTATRILRNRSGGEDSLYLSILRAEREFERTRMFWDYPVWHRLMRY